MAIHARDAMQTRIETVSPKTTWRDLESELLSQRVGGFPVVEGERLVGIVSRSDIVRKLDVEQVMAEQVSEFYRELDGYRDSGEPVSATAERVGARLAGVTVGEIMVKAVVTVSPDQPIDEVAATLCDHKVHRVPVVDDGRLVGIITTLDLVQLIARRKLTAS